MSPFVGARYPVQSGQVGAGRSAQRLYPGISPPSPGVRRTFHHPGNVRVLEVKIDYFFTSPRPSIDGRSVVSQRETERRNATQLVDRPGQPKQPEEPKRRGSSLRGPGGERPSSEGAKGEKGEGGVASEGARRRGAHSAAAAAAAALSAGLPPAPPPMRRMYSSWYFWLAASRLTLKSSSCLRNVGRRFKGARSSS